MHNLCKLIGVEYYPEIFSFLMLESDTRLNLGKVTIEETYYEVMKPLKSSVLVPQAFMIGHTCMMETLPV